MSIFQKSVINNHLSQLDKEQVDKAFEKFNENYSFSKIAEIQKMKEEEYQDGFLRDIFVDVFGYTLKPADNYNLAREFKNQTDGKKADGAILKNDKAIAVIELKSTKTKDLTNVTQQAFNYKNNQPECKYVITSNFQKLRFYIDYSNEYEEFDLFNMQKDNFQLLYLLLQKDSILTDLPLKLKTETKFHEENISDKLYKDYSSFKYKIYNNLVKNNPQYDKLTLFKKSQKFLDRLLFVFFAEDTGLVPPNAISKIVEQWQLFIDNDEYFSLYSRFVKFFIHLDKGHKYKTYDLPAYNGGLFAPDEILDSITIDDEVLKNDALLLSSYDYSTEVDVNILGHIFEHSLNEIEEITAEIEGTTSDKNKTKRKKDGVFYTPKYITQYIVENTIGKLCIEKREKLGILEIEFDESIKTKKGKLSASGKKLFETLQAYKDWLFSLKIVDPACGSGAFLNQALNFLINEHQQIDDIIADLTSETLRLFDTDKTILDKNLFGVDINDESVEIAKLSLWLRTAQKGRKLSKLNNNIKCGNSLIDDPEVAGEKAFNWQKEFPHIFRKKEKKIWHVTTATHNSRYSQRMFDNFVKAGEPVWLSEKEEIIVTETISEIADNDKLNIVAYNICGDHAHLVLVCEEEELQKIVQKIKSMSARACNIAMGRTISTSENAPTQCTGTTMEPTPTICNGTTSERAPTQGNGTTMEPTPTICNGTTSEHTPRQCNGTTSEPAPTHCAGTTTEHTPTQCNGTTSEPTPTQCNGTTSEPTPTICNGITSKPAPTQCNGTTSESTPTQCNGTTSEPAPMHCAGTTTEHTPAQCTGTTSEHTPTQCNGTTSELAPTHCAGATSTPGEHAPLRGKTQHHLWARKFNQKEITSNEQFDNTIAYIQNNRVKHKLPENKALKKLANKMCCTPQHAHRKEYTGGFDVVIGNPPYVQSHSISEFKKKFIYKNYKTTEYQINTYGVFVEQFIKLLKLNSFYSLIIPNYWLSTKFDRLLRKEVFIENHALEVINTFEVFESATVDTLILTGQKVKTANPETSFYSISKNCKTIEERLNAINLRLWEYSEQKDFSKGDEEIFISFSEEFRLKGESILKDYLVFKKGMQPYEKGKGNPQQTREMMNEKVYHSNIKKDETYFPLLGAKHIQRHFLVPFSKYIKYGKNLAAPRNPEIFKGERILINRILSKNKIDGVLLSETYINNTDVFNLIPKQNNSVSIKVLYALIVSKLCATYFKKANVNLNRNAFPKINVNTLESFPVPEILPEIQNQIELQIDSIITQTLEFQKSKSKFIELVKDNLAVNSISKKMDTFYESNFKIFLSELKKQKVTLSLADQSEWKDFFESSKLEINKLQSEIEKTDKEIDKMVYQLYGLTEDEIAIVENSIK
jgi:type I restriction-modification system DNA methylase subunit